MAFKDEMKADIAVFLNENEFAETHKVEGKNIVCVLDEDDSNIGGGKILGVSEKQIRLFAKVEDLPARRQSGASLRIDGRLYEIDSWSDDIAVAVIVLKERVSE